ncbi:MAG: dihydroneopterin aldolase [Synechococcaceae cyanobacterium SM2_3_2]|nr:dihydroneopterin aldolase [Synechococcaceae cyanobacterium SM2_3_2]
MLLDPADAAALSTLRDRIRVSGMRFYGYTGYLPAERELGQWFEVDLELWADLRPAAQSGQLSDTYDYIPAVQKIAELVQNQSFELIESLAEAIADIALRETGSPQVKVRLTKCSPPVPEISGSVSLEIIRP